jgi:hypothetical protein
MITILPATDWSTLGSPNGSPLRSPGIPDLPGVARETIELGVARVKINHHFFKVLFDFDDCSGYRILELYQGSSIQPIKVDISLGNGENYTGYYWVQERLDTYPILFKDLVTEHCSIPPKGVEEVVINFPAPSEHNWDIANARYNIRTGINSDRVSICQRNDVKFIWAQAQVRDLYGSFIK